MTVYVTTESYSQFEFTQKDGKTTFRRVGPGSDSISGTVKKINGSIALGKKIEMMVLRDTPHYTSLYPQPINTTPVKEIKVCL